MRTRIISLLGGWLAVAGVLATDAAAQTQEPAELRVLAAASLTEVVQELAKRFEGARVVTSFGASGDLARQIKDGAPADVFISASPDWITFLREASALDGAPVVLARNELVAIAPKGSSLAEHGVTDPKVLLDRLATGDRIGIADAGVPAGDYSRKALDKLGLSEAYEPRLVGLKDVRAVLHAVEQGEIQAGFVYATDARVAKVARLFTFDRSSHPPIEYQAAALRRAANPVQARKFVADLESEATRTLLKNAGFVLP